MKDKPPSAESMLPNPCEFICQSCGKRAPGVHNRIGDWFKPRSWFSRVDDDGAQVACSRECIQKIAEATKKTPVVLPV